MGQRIVLPFSFLQRCSGLPVADAESLKFYPEKLYHCIPFCEEWSFLQAKSRHFRTFSMEIACGMF
ncbi:hypothetical protein [Nitratireductor aquibiodomus]|uniref:hypothetical protein n=1 Tax=Nitratireductor aquibiodomus TaxID=204799 RepID=UPI0004685CBA|nr:hypothetical protein [Nitratireductor aquibiodomus]